MTKFDLAFKAVYNKAYVAFINTLDAAEGVDTAHLVAAHGYAAFKADRDIQRCKCGGTGTYWVRCEPRPNPNGGSMIVANPEQCFGCAGKGYQSESDQRRNWGYWSFYARIEA
jgi:hypothetical protein